MAAPTTMPATVPFGRRFGGGEVVVLGGRGVEVVEALSLPVAALPILLALDDADFEVLECATVSVTLFVGVVVEVPKAS